MGTRIHVKTFAEHLEEMKKLKKSKKKGSPEEKELMELIMKHGLVEGGILYLKKHPEAEDLILEEAKKKMKEEGFSDDEIKEKEEMIRKLLKVYKNMV